MTGCGAAFCLSGSVNQGASCATGRLRAQALDARRPALSLVTVDPNIACVQAALCTACTALLALIAPSSWLHSAEWAD